MDSFYDVPRRAPAPTKIEGININPAVPEVSLICPSKTHLKSYDTNDRLCPKMNSKVGVYTHTYSTENTLRELHVCSNTDSKYPVQHPTQFCRKQVRFESPISQQRPSLTYEPYASRKMDNPETSELSSANNGLDSKIPISNKCGMHQKMTFEEIYMANIPNRHLDLSMIDIPKVSTDVAIKESVIEDIQKNKENELPKTYREFLETQKKISKAQKSDQRITDILNYKRNNIGISHDTSHCFPNSYRAADKRNGDQFALFNNSNHSCKSEASHQSSPGVADKAPDVECTALNSQNILRNAFNKLYNFDHENFMKDDKIQCYKDEDDRKVIDYIPNHGMQQINESFTKMDIKNKVDSFEPTNRDLLKIITQQNEQLLLLQTQVALLLNKEHNSQRKPIEPASIINDNVEYHRKEIDNEPTRFVPEINLTPRKGGLSKFSVDVMTSFEVAIRPQHNRQLPINYNSSKIQEITEEESTVSSTTDINKKTLEHSIHLQEPMKVMEPCQSPEPSININMNDYDSSDDEVSASEIGATFYHNLMGQVNKILKQAQIQTREDLCSRGIDARRKVASSKVNRTMHRVREATLKHLREIGVTVGSLEEVDYECPSYENDSREYSPTEISYGVKQLLMKYLPDEHLAKLSNNPKQPRIQGNSQEMPNLRKAKPEFSFASLEYMKKYNLLPCSGDIPEKKEDPFVLVNTDENDRKILDLTALKMQPKLV